MATALCPRPVAPPLSCAALLTSVPPRASDWRAALILVEAEARASMRGGSARIDERRKRAHR
eukprot:2557282-Pleurochrysis_carterae.AAC.1